MSLIEKIVTTLGKIVSSIVIVFGAMLFFLIIGFAIYEYTNKSNSGVFILIFFSVIGAAVGFQAARKSNQIGFIKFISKVNSTNEMDDPDQVKKYFDN